ncbi:L-threonylcarbamoyladenylate synthase [Granulicella aggregans]|jgi:L-threonylcarbamoyladenylate synthase|uniref:L-threonylcarbamoyladenylate synthase n=1 Tax=Granulicella aggregans TaxID=474949 RepID=UPI0021E0EA56|nr:L-threonylcarbamoyladenylate synthase [Granulicella aggregans]
MNGLCKTEHLFAHEGENRGGIERAAEVLRGGGTVAFPTETVYGLGANALDATAIAKIFTAKERPEWDPLIVHVSDREMMARVAEVPEEFSARVGTLIEAFWPGPLTLLLPRTSAVPDAVTAGRPLVGVRMPGHPVAMELIRLAGVPVAAPSANRFGRTSPTTAGHVLEDLDGRIDAVLDGGATRVGIESTVLDVLKTPMVVYRPGAVTAAMIFDATGVEVELFRAAASVDSVPESLPSPGVGLRHYAPRARLVLVSVEASGDVTHSLHAAIEQAQEAEEKVGVILPEEWDASYAEETFVCGEWGDDDAFAHRIFAGLRWLDSRGVDVIVCPVPSGDGVAVALRDRLEKAARRK